MHDLARARRELIHEQVHTDMLMRPQAPGGAHKRGVYKTGGGDFLAPWDDVVRKVTREHVDDDHDERDGKHEAGEIRVQVLENLLHPGTFFLTDLIAL